MAKEQNYCKQQRSKNKRKEVGAIILALLILLLAIIVPNYLSEVTKRTNVDGLVGTKSTQNFVTLIDSQRTKWDFLDDGKVPEIDSKNRNWREAGYDGNWKKARGSFGAQNGQRTTHVGNKLPDNLLNQYSSAGVSAPVMYFRTEFDVDAIRDDWELRCSFQYDDAAVIYLNGKAVYRANNPAGGFDGDGYGSDVKVGDSNKETVLLDTKYLKKGRNTIAVEVHQNYYSSSDVYFAMQYLRYEIGEGAGNLSNAGNVILLPGNNESSVKVNWFTRNPGKYMLEYTEENSYMKTPVFDKYVPMEVKSTKEGSLEAYSYTASMSKLEPGVNYVYRIVNSAKDEMSENYKYLCRDTSNGFSVLFVGDPQIGSKSISRDKASWEEVINQGVSKNFYDSSFLISAGDQVDSSDHESALREYNAFRSIKVLRNLPIMAARGNHDSATEYYQLQFNYDSIDQNNDYFFKYGETLFYHIDSNIHNYSDHGARLKAAIAKTKPRWIVVVTHYSIFSSGPHVEDESIILARNYYSKLFAKLDVDLVLSGHDHMYARTYLMKGSKSTGKDGGTKKKGETLYLTGNSGANNKYYSAAGQKFSYLAELSNVEDAFVSSISFKHNTMTIITYDIKTLDKVDVCTIKKD